MNIIRYAVAIFLMSVIMIASGCRTRICDFTVMSTKNIPVEFARKGQGEGEDVARIIIIIPTKSQPNLKEAIDQAIESRNGDMLLNAKVYMRNWYIPYIYGENGFTVKGDVVSTRE